MLHLDVAVTADPHLVLALLQQWKPGDAYAYVRSDRLDALVGRIDGEPVGVLVGTHDFGNWDILEAYQHLTEKRLGSYVQAAFVLPGYRSHGVGSSLVSAFVNQATRAGSPVVVAWPDEEVGDFNARVRFFEQNGFRWLRYPGGTKPPWLMGRPLA